MAITRDAKRRLVARVRAAGEARIAALRKTLEAEAAATERELRARLIRHVPRPLWDVRVRDVVALEREHRLVLKTLVADLAAYKDSLFEASTGSLERMRAGLQRRIDAGQRLSGSMLRGSGPSPHASG